MSLEQFRALGQDRLNTIYGGLDPKYLDLQAGNADGWDPDASMWAERAVQEQKLGDQWRNSLDPATRDQWDKDLAFQTAQHKKHMGLGMKLAMAAITAGAGGMALGAGGGLEGLFGGAGEVAGGSNLGGTGIMAEGGMFSPEMLSLDQAMSLSSQMPTTSFGGFGGAAAPAAGIGSGFEGTGFLTEGGMFSPEAMPFNQASSIYSQLPTTSFGGLGTAGTAGAGMGAGFEGTGLMSENGMFSPELMPIDQGMQVASNMPTTDIGGAWAGGGGSSSNSLFSKLREMLPSGPTEALKMASSLGGLYSNYQSNRNFSNLASNLAGLYGPGSAYEEQLRKELQRRDAAAGRRSQYGPRAVELQARLAQLASGQSQSLANIYGQENASRNNMINSGLKLADQMGIWGKLASLFGN